MSSHIEMQKLAQNPAAVGSLASYLLKLTDIGWTDWEIDFLDSMAGRSGREPISLRQREKLIELRDDARTYSSFDGFSVSSLVDRCWQARLDLSEDDEDFIVRLHDQRANSLKRRPVLRLLHCARQLHLIDGFVDID